MRVRGEKGLKDEGCEKVTIKLPTSELGGTSRFRIGPYGVPISSLLGSRAY